MYLQSIKNWEKAVLSLLDFYGKTNQPLAVDFWKDETYAKIKNGYQWLINKQVNLN